MPHDTTQRCKRCGQPPRNHAPECVHSRLMRDPIPRFWKKVTKTDGCWLWRNPDPSNGYGKFSYQGQVMGAHRVSWLIHYGDISDGLWVLHKCDTPACVNPDHLFLGTHDDNMADMTAKHRGRYQQHPETVTKGEQHGNAKLTENDVREIRRLRANGTPRQTVAQMFGISQSNVKQITARTAWAHVF